MQKKLRMMDINHKENDFCMRFIFLRGGDKNEKTWRKTLTDGYKRWYLMREALYIGCHCTLRREKTF